MSLFPLLPSPASLLSWMLLSTVLLGTCWLFYRLLLRDERCFQFNRRFLLYTPWLVLALPPLLGLLGPWLASWLLTWQTLLPSTSGLLAGGVLPTVTVRGAGAPDSAGPAIHWLVLLYGAGVLALLSYKAWQLFRLWQTARTWPSEAREGYTLAYTGGQLPVSSFGHCIFWDETLALSTAEAAQVMRHEEAHVRLGHSQERLALELARVLLWFNPFVHFYPAALELTHELLADEAVLGQSAADDTTAESYTTLLARVALRQLHPELPLTHSFTQSFTLTRIRMLTSHSPVRRWKQWLLVPLSTALLLLVACEKATDPASVITKSDASLSEAPPPPPPALEAEDTPPPPPPPPPVYSSVEHMPEYVGGQEQLLADIGKQVKYPASALDEKLEGSVFIKFIIAPDGSMQAIQLQKGIETTVNYPGSTGEQQTTKLVTPGAQAMNDVAMAAVRSLDGKWKPGTQDGRPVAVFMTVPITFSLK